MEHVGNELRDRTMMDRVRDGDVGAESELYQLHADAVVRRAIRLGWQPADAEDYVQEAFVRVLSQLRKGRGPDHAFRPYLIAAVRNVAVDARRAGSSRELLSEVEVSLPPSGAAADPQHYIEIRHCVQLAMLGLPPRWRDILWRLDHEGETPASVAAELGATAQAVSAVAYRARRAFRLAYLAIAVAEAALAEQAGPPAPESRSETQLVYRLVSTGASI